MGVERTYSKRKFDIIKFTTHDRTKANAAYAMGFSVAVQNELE